jgi:hypothetical protein
LRASITSTSMSGHVLQGRRTVIFFAFVTLAGDYTGLLRLDPAI